MSISLSRDEHLTNRAYGWCDSELRECRSGDAQEGELRRVKRGVEKRDLNADGMKGNVLCLTEVRQNGSSEGRYEDRDFR